MYGGVFVFLAGQDLDGGVGDGDASAFDLFTEQGFWRFYPEDVQLGDRGADQDGGVAFFSLHLAVDGGIRDDGDVLYVEGAADLVQGDGTVVNVVEAVGFFRYRL